MAIPRGYTSNHKILDRMGRVTPNVEYSPGERPHFESFAAPWLPVQRYEYEIDTYYVINSGKVVAEDKNGMLVPAGLRKAWNVASGTTILTYTATDAAEGVRDLTTGQQVTGAVSYTEAQVTAALKERGFIRPDQRAMDFISKPIGIASYNYYKASGEDHWDPAKLFQHNFRPQALTAVTCDYVITVPLVPATEATETMNGDLANDAGSIDWSSTRTGGWFGSTAINGLVAYANEVAADADVVCYIFEKFPLAHITQDTPITHSNNQLVRQAASVKDITAAGDYFFDYDLGILFLYEAGGNAIPTGWAVTDTITYFQYEDQVEAARVSDYVCATGNLDYGDFVTYDANSNLIKASLDIANAEGYNASGALYSADPEYDTETDNAVVSSQLEQAIDNHLFGVVGQVIGANDYPKGMLDKVKTAFHGYSAANMRTPGSATGGRTDQLTYANAAEKMLIVNLIFR
jgi:hypothetical protein